VFRPLVEYFWDRKQTEIFLNYELQEKAFSEIHNFEEKIYFDYLIKTENFVSTSSSPGFPVKKKIEPSFFAPFSPTFSRSFSPIFFPELFPGLFREGEKFGEKAGEKFGKSTSKSTGKTTQDCFQLVSSFFKSNQWEIPRTLFPGPSGLFFEKEVGKKYESLVMPVFKKDYGKFIPLQTSEIIKVTNPTVDFKSTNLDFNFNDYYLHLISCSLDYKLNFPSFGNSTDFRQHEGFFLISESKKKVEPTILVSSFFNHEAESKNTEFIFRKKTRELADHYNNESISAITNLLADFMGLLILLFLLVNMKMSLMNTTAFLSESFFSLKDSKKAFLMLLFTDLLVGFHSPRGWEVIFHFLFEHFGLPENHNIIFLLVGTFPVLLDALFKYWIFRHLNRHSPATVATFQAMVE